MHTKESILAAIQAIRMQTGVKRIVQDVINELPDESEVVEVDGCGNCPFYNYIQMTHVICRFDDRSAENRGLLFASCPLQTKSITIKLKDNEQ